MDVEGAYNLLKEISLLENLSVRGLMTMPPYFNAPEKVRPYFSALRDLKNSLEQKGC